MRVGARRGLRWCVVHRLVVVVRVFARGANAVTDGTAQLRRN
jgi:hypothetical protein